MDDFPLDGPEQLIDSYTAQLRPLVRMIRQTIEPQLFADASVGEMLEGAPAELCVQLSEIWGAAEMMGVTATDLLIVFEPTDRFVIEMVTGLYCASRPGLFDSPAGLLDNSGLIPQPV